MGTRGPLFLGGPSLSQVDTGTFFSVGSSLKSGAIPSSTKPFTIPGPRELQAGDSPRHSERPLPWERRDVPGEPDLWVDKARREEGASWKEPGGTLMP